ncbi:flagellar basal body-associated FliL family protein [Yoonia sp. 2307UL14-13]|uniref:flagellar basal body-associated FliL family protein n=1 Tax=Yoonia sp. 2307UL14-13 TaxID=3126506 RepID=UPI0030956F97
MMKLLIPVIFAAVGVGGGVGAGLMLKSEEDANAESDEHHCDVPDEVTDGQYAPPVGDDREYAKLNNQFVVPVVEDEKVAALVVMSLNLEVVTGGTTTVFSAEPRLRHEFLQGMFNHANIGGFSGNFTSPTNMRTLRDDLLRRAQNVLGETVTDVLIIDIVRQDS